MWVLSLGGELEFHSSWPKQKKYCNKLSKDFKNGPHQKKKFKKKQWTVRLEGPDHVGSESLNSTLLSRGTLEGFSEGVPESDILLRKTALAAG